MKELMELLRRPRGSGGARLVLGLGAVTVWLVLAAIVGAIALRDDETSLDAGANGPSVTSAPGEQGPSGGDDEPVIDPATGETIPPGAIDPVTGKPRPGTSPGTGRTTATTAAGGGGPGDRTGVTSSQIKVGIHAPKTFSGVPLNLAEDPIKGIEAFTKYINDRGGIHGRKIALQIVDDRFDTPGAQAAANALINDGKNFVVSGTLGIDQVAIVAAEAARRGVPYMAGGGAEEVPINGMYQLGTSYTTHVLELAEFIAKDPNLKGKRVGILVSDSQYIKPVANTFKKRLEELGQKVSTIVANQKPAQNPDYNGYILQFRSANTEVVVPLTDPLTTQQIVQRCAAGAACGWTYSFSDFAHESDTALALMAPTWSNQHVRGLAAACYYLAAEVDGTNCANMKVARAQYIAVNGQDDWDENGSGAAAGYQLVSFLKGALGAAGSDLTRERLRAAWNAYDNYADLISSPITFRGRPSTMHGSERMTVFEAQSNVKYKMITPGFVDSY
ncbi:MAG TPA: ABC transporter substrate-binding protein [Acidimicrobiales bacterium]|nr:ABC transporter substrate-binding protein [Acidimicrobiales bacterium]